MKRPAQLTLVCTLATLLMACDTNQGTDKGSSAPAATVEPTAEVTTPVPVVTHNEDLFPEPGKFAIELAPGNVSIRANQVHELDILESLAADAKFDLLAGDIVWKTVTVDIREDNLHAALVALIRAYPYQIVYTPGEDGRQEVLSEVVISEQLPAVNTASPVETATEDQEPSEAEDDPSDPETLAYLQALKNPSAEVRAAAADDIEVTGDALYALTDLIINDPSPEVRMTTARALEFSDDPLAIQALVTCLKDEYPAVVLECIGTLEHIGDASTATELQPMLEHYDETVRATAAQAIEDLQ